MSDRFRPEYRELDADEKNLAKCIKDCAAEMEMLYNKANQGSRADYHSKAIEALEISVMWIIKELTA